MPLFSRQKAKPITIDYRVFYAPKYGNELHHYEDAFALAGVEPVQLAKDIQDQPLVQGRLDPAGLVWRCAVADGATQGGFSKYWAQMLVDHFVYDVDAPKLSGKLNGMDGWLKSLCERWNQDKVPEILAPIPQGSPRRSRVQQSLLMEGQAATLVMLELHTDPERLEWRAGAIGDSLLFHFHNGKIQPERPFNTLRWDELDTNPVLISTRESNQDAWIWQNRGFQAEQAFVFSAFEAGDSFILMTDALAKWFLRLLEERMTEEDLGQERFETEMHAMFSLYHNYQFENWLNERRGRPRDDRDYIGNDDSTLVIVHITEDQEGALPVEPFEPRRIPVPNRPKDEMIYTVVDTTVPPPEVFAVPAAEEEDTLVAGAAAVFSEAHTPPHGYQMDLGVAGDAGVEAADDADDYARTPPFTPEEVPEETITTRPSASEIIRRIKPLEESDGLPPSEAPTAARAAAPVAPERGFQPLADISDELLDEPEDPRLDRDTRHAIDMLMKECDGLLSQDDAKDDEIRAAVENLLEQSPHGSSQVLAQWVRGSQYRRFRVIFLGHFLQGKIDRDRCLEMLNLSYIMADIYRKAINTAGVSDVDLKDYIDRAYRDKGFGPLLEKTKHRMRWAEGSPVRQAMVNGMVLFRKKPTHDSRTQWRQLVSESYRKD